MTEPAARSGGATPEADPEGVAAFLRAHPGFLAANPGLYDRLAPPRRVHGDVLADHMAAMLARARDAAASMAARADLVLAAGRVASGLTGRVQEAVLALMAATEPAECVTEAFPGLLGLDAAALCMEAEGPDPNRPRMRILPPGMVARLLDGRDALLGAPAAHAALLHGEAARLAAWDALARVPWGGPPCLLALARRDALPAAATEATGAAPAPVYPVETVPGSLLGALAFLGRAIGAALDRAG